MRTNVEIDDRLMARAKEVSGLKTKKAVLHLALEQLIADYNRPKFADLFGANRIRDDYDLDEIRRNRFEYPELTDDHS